MNVQITTRDRTLKKTFKIQKKDFSVMHIWLVSYLIVLIVPVLFGILNFTAANNVVKENNATINSLTLNQTALSVNRIFSDTESIGRQLLYQKEVTSLSYATMPLNTFKREKIASLQEKIREQTAFSGYIHDIFIYFPNPQICSSTQGFLESDSFFRMLSEKYDLDEASFHNLAYAGDSYQIRMLGSDESEQAARLAVIITNASNNNQVNSICIMILKPDIIKNLLTYDNDSISAEQRHLWVTDGSKFISLSQAETLAADLNSRLPMEHGSAETTVLAENTHEQRYMISVLDIGISDWNIVSAVPRTQYQLQKNTLLLWFVAFLSFCLVLGVFISLILANRNFLPIKNLSKLIASQDYHPEHKNEFSYITSSFSRLIEEKQTYKRELSAQQLTLQHLNLVRMLNGTIHTKKAFLSACTDYDIRFSSFAFIVIGFKVLECRNISGSSEEEFEEKELRPRAFHAIGDALNCILADDCDFYICERSGCYFAILSVDSAQYTGDRLVEELKLVLPGIQQTHDIVFQVFTSKVYKDHVNPATSIHLANNEVTWCSQQAKAFSITEGILSKQDIMALLQKFHDDRIQPAGGKNPNRRQLVQLLMKGKLTEAEELFPQLLNEGVAKLNPDFTYVRLHCMFLIDYIVSNLEPAQLKDAGSEIRQLCDSVMQISNMPDLQAIMLDGLSMFSLTFKNKAVKEDSGSLYEEVVRYIDTNYRDMNLSVSSIADHFSLSQSYLLRVFKKEAGSGILDYIRQKRIDEAKILLKATSETLSKIAETVGYTNSLTLIRAFKRLEGITPSEYRNML